MSLRFIIGRAGSGKTELAMSELRARLAKEPDGPPLIWLVPEQATFQADYAFVAGSDVPAVIRAQSLSFRRLAYRILQETGGTAHTYIDDTGKKMLLYKLANERKRELRAFRSGAEQASFIDKLSDMMTEWKRYRLEPEQLEQAFGLHPERRETPPAKDGLLRDKLHDLILFYRAFEADMAGHYVDSEDDLALLADSIPAADSMRKAEIWVDGFNGFTPQEMRVMGQLMTHSANVNVLLTLDRDVAPGAKLDEFDLFHPTAWTMSRLKELAAGCGVPVEDTVVLQGTRRFAAGSMLGELEQGYGRRGKGNPSSRAHGAPAAADERGSARHGVTINAAMNRRVEVEWTAREIVRLAADEGVRWRDMAVLMRNIEQYADVVASVFSDYGIPMFLDAKRPVSHHPLIEFISSSLEVISRHWRYEAVFRCAKTDFLLPLAALSDEAKLEHARRGIDALENYVLSFGLQGSKWTHDQRWTYVPSSGLEADEKHPDASSELERHQAMLGRIDRLRKQVAEPLLAFGRKLKAAETVQDMAASIYELLSEVRAGERLQLWSRQAALEGQPEKAREHAQLWDRVMDVLDQVVELLGPQKLSIEEFAGILETGLSSIRLGLVPPSLDQVLVGSMERTRSGRIKRLFLLGVNDGVLPAKIGESGVLSEPERERLEAAGIELAPGARRRLLDEQFLIYSALTSPEEHLWLSYPLADEEGKALLPSDIVRRMKKLVPAAEQRFLLAEPEPDGGASSQLPFAAHPNAALSMLLVQLRRWKAGQQIDGLWWTVYNWFCSRPQWHDALSKRLTSLFYTNREAPLSQETSVLLYGETLTASVSRLERFAACPFAHFASHGLRLKERKLYKLEAPDIGQLFHAALNGVARELMKSGRSFADANAEELYAIVERVVQALKPRLQSEILLSSKRHGYIASKLQHTIAGASSVLADQARRGSFVPVGLELPFGAGDDAKLPPLQLALPGGRNMTLEGRIDRVDQAVKDAEAWLRVIDYKSSVKPFSLTEVYYGLSLQLLAYLDVAVTNAESWLGRPAEPAGVFYFHVHNPVLTTSGPVAAQSAEEERFKRFKLKGLVLESAQAVKQMDAALDSGHSPVIPVQLKKDGTFGHRSSVASPERWKQLTGYVRGKMTELGDSLTSGEVDVRPYKLGGKTACGFCPYKPVCQIDKGTDTDNYRALRPIGGSDVWTLVEAAAGVPAQSATDGRETT